ncbi:MAG: ribosome maturation factor RimP [Planctomycetota bacterium]
MSEPVEVDGPAGEGPEVEGLLLRLVEEVLAARGFEVVQLRSPNPWRLTAWIDREPEPVGVDDCADLTREVRSLLDERGLDPGDFELELQSPGLDRPLTRDKDFVRFAGQQVRIRLHAPDLSGRKRFTGKLLGLDEGGNVLVRGAEAWSLPRAHLAECRLVPDLPTPKDPHARSRKPRKSRRKRPKEH